MRRLLPAACVALLLAGCATTPVSREPLPGPAQQTLLHELSSFRFAGRAAVRAGEDGFSASLSWRQHAGESQLQLSGLLGAGGLHLVYGPNSLRVTTSRGEKLEGGEAERALSSRLGFVPPF